MAEIIEENVVSSSNSGDIDYGKALSWMFKDPNFGSILLKGSLLLLSFILVIPIFYVIPVFIGFTLDLTRNLQNGKYELPGLGAEGQWKDGIILSLLGLAFSLMIGLLVGGGTTLASFAALQNGASPEQLSTYSNFLNIPSMLLNALTITITMMVYPIYAKTQDVGSLFNVSNYKNMWDNNGSVLIISALIVWVVSQALTMVGLFAFCFGLLPAIVITYMVKGSFYGHMNVDGIE